MSSVIHAPHFTRKACVVKLELAAHPDERALERTETLAPSPNLVKTDILPESQASLVLCHDVELQLSGATGPGLGREDLDHLPAKTAPASSWSEQEQSDVPCSWFGVIAKGIEDADELHFVRLEDAEEHFVLRVAPGFGPSIVDGLRLGRPRRVPQHEFVIIRAGFKQGLQLRAIVCVQSSRAKQDTAQCSKLAHQSAGGSREQAQ